MSDPNDWMWSDALKMLAKAEQMHRQLFQPVAHSAQIAWQPPVDVLETENEVLVLAALPGVDAATATAVIEGATLIISGVRVLPKEVRIARIHRLELPQGRFERRVPLPPGRYADVRRTEAHGCLVISLAKA